MKIKFFESDATFKKKVEVESGVTKVIGSVEFMVCDDTRCLPPTEVDLVFNFEKETSALSGQNHTLLNL